MAEIRLVFGTTQGSQDQPTAQTVRVDYVAPGGSLTGCETRPFSCELNDQDYADLRWYLEEFMDCPDGGSKIRAARVERLIDDWGRRFYDAVFDHGDHRDRLNELLQIKQPEPRLLTIASSEGDVLRLPWELIADGRGPLSRQGVTVRRQLETGKKNLDYPVSTPLRILLVVSRPDDAGFIDPRHSTRAMFESLRPLVEEDKVVVDFCRPPTLARLEEMLSQAADAKAPYTIVHFDGHGNYDRLLGLGVLYFEKSQQAAAGNVEGDRVRADVLGNLLAKYEIPLVILEACRTSDVDAVAFRSVAPRLIEAGVGSVIAMSYAVHVEAAKILIERFYRELANGRTIGAAVEGGRAALLVNRDRWLKRGPGEKAVELTDWFLPQLYQRGNDLTLVTSTPKKRRQQPEDRKKRAQVPTGQEVGAFPRPPLYGFFGRARELYKLERAFRLDRAVLLHAMGGMGKTTLAGEAAAWLTETGLFPDGACFVSFERPTTAERVAQVLGTYLEGPEFVQRTEAEQLKDAVALFQSKRVLMVWDNYESVLPTFARDGGGADEGYSEEERSRLESQFRDLTELPEGHGRLLVTCRPGESGLPGVRRMGLAGLERADSLYLLAEVMRKRDLSLDNKRFTRENLDRLLDSLSDHPLSIELVGPHLADLDPERIVDEFDKLLEKFTGEAEVARNRSLLASLCFSGDRLSPAARAAWTWLGLFRGGVFEQLLVDVSQIEPKAWDAVRAELEGTALLRVERDIEVSGRPYLRFHPTLAYATQHGSEVGSGAAVQVAEGAASIIKLSDLNEARRRFIKVYRLLNAAIGKALRSTGARGAMEVLSREEANFRAAVRWAVEMGEYDVGAVMGGTFSDYLQRSTRFRERDRWVAWLAEKGMQVKFSAAVAQAERESAWSLFTQGHAQKAIEKLEALIDRLKSTTEFDAAIQLAAAQSMLGRVYYASGHAERAIPILEKAVKDWENFAQLAAAREETAEAERGNLSAALGDLANALRQAGRLDQAMEVSERGIGINRQLGHDRDVAMGLGRTAHILMQQGRYGEADARYDEALAAARRLGDMDLKAITLVHQGGLADELRQYDRAISLYQQALKLFQDAHDDASVMQTCNMLGVVEQRVGRLAEARAWYERSRDMAKRRNDRASLAVAAQNIGTACQAEGEAAREKKDEASAHRHFLDAERFLRESLDIEIERKHKPGEAQSCIQLAQLYVLTGELDKAETFAKRGVYIDEDLGLTRELPSDYNTLAKIARARGDAAQAAEWEAKHYKVVKELERRAGGGEGGARAPEQLVQAVAALSIACLQAGLGSSPLPAKAADALATLENPEHPLRPIVPLLRDFAAGKVPATADAVPAELPQELRHVLGQLIHAVHEAPA